MNYISFSLLCLIGIALCGASYTGTCKVGDSSCTSYATGPFCCNATQGEQCFQGYQSGICCVYPNQGCCGNAGYATGGCKCRTAQQQCCGNLANTICASTEICCRDANLDKGACCNANTQVCDSTTGTCKPKPNPCNCSGSNLCCQDVLRGNMCYSPTVYDCVTDPVLQGPVLCGKGTGSCNGVCYNKTYYKCSGGQIVPI